MFARIAVSELQPIGNGGSGAVWRSGTGVPPVNHAQDAGATFKLHHYRERVKASSGLAYSYLYRHSTQTIRPLKI
jgi:hypothetical protein